MLRLNRILWSFAFISGSLGLASQNAAEKISLAKYPAGDSISVNSANTPVSFRQFISTSEFIDAAINSLNAFNILIKKENYRSKIISLNNPAGSDLGFNLETEIQAALKPILEKTRSVNTTKFAEVISEMTSATSSIASNVSLATANPLFATVLSLVGNLVIHEKKVTRGDLDLFIQQTSRYFMQYEKLNLANVNFDNNIRKLNNSIADLEFDIKEYMLDMIIIMYNNSQRNELKKLNVEELLLKYLDKQKLEAEFKTALGAPAVFFYPSDGIKTAKEIAYGIQKLFNEYQKIYNENYYQIREILGESRSLATSVNTKQVDASMKELELLYNESKNSDILGLRLNTLFERLKTLANTDQEKD